MDRDKRDYYRLPDSILVDYQFVSERETETTQAADFFTSDGTFHLLRDLYELQLESKELLRSIQQEQRALGRFLSNLDTRVELIARAVTQSSQEDPEAYDSEVEISEGGVSFLAREHMTQGQHLALRLVFQPSYLGLACFGEVRHCQPSGHDYRIGVEFKHIDLQTQRIISRHIVSKQSEQRRARLHGKS